MNHCERHSYKAVSLLRKMQPETRTPQSEKPRVQEGLCKPPNSFTEAQGKFLQEETKQCPSPVPPVLQNLLYRCQYSLKELG